MNEHKRKSWTKDELIKSMLDYNLKIGFPTSRGFKAKNGYPSYSCYIKEFGSWENAILESGISIPKNKKHLFGRMEYTDEHLLNKLKNVVDLCKETNRTLYTNKEIDKDRSMPSATAYHKRFGGVQQAYAKLGINMNEFNDNIMICKLKNQYTEIKAILNRVPNSRDFDDFSKKYGDKYHSASTYISYFGSIKNLQIHMGDKPTNWSTSLSDEEMLDMLRCSSEEIGREITSLEMSQEHNVPNRTSYARRFGSLTNAKRLAGIKHDTVRSKLTTPNGNVALSGYEYKFIRMMEEYNIPFSKEVLYSTYINNFEGKHRFDFVIELNGQTYMVEIFGIVGSDRYDKTKELKVKLCNKYSLPLISLCPEDILHKTFEEMYEDLLEKSKKIRDN